MHERRVLDLIELEVRRRGLPALPASHPLVWKALRVAALQIVRECESDCRAAARTASLVGFAVTRGRTRL